MVDFARALAGPRHRHHHLQFPLHRTAAEDSRSRAGARGLLSRGHRDRATRGRERAARLFIGGKSMGGRIATQVAAADPDRPLAGLVLLGYPLHPPGRPDKRRDTHLPDVRPMLFVQGSRDAFGTPEELAPVAAAMPPPPRCTVAGATTRSRCRRRRIKPASTRWSSGRSRLGWRPSARRRSEALQKRSDRRAHLVSPFVAAVEAEHRTATPASSSLVGRRPSVPACTIRRAIPCRRTPRESG